MKKIAIILVLAIASCNQQTDLPIPIDEVTTTTITTTTTNEDFTGTWDCFEWVVDEITGATAHKRIMFSNQLENSAYISVNIYYDNGNMNQLISNTGVSLDSNYFDNSINPIDYTFKGVKTSDSTMMVYQYYNSGLSVDTTQVKEFKKL